ncbi:MAG: hypothetical protein R3B70_36885 [Polyangiaceae bacterium]
MFTSRLVLALTVGLGLSLSACVTDQDSEFDVQSDTPTKKAMGNGGGLNGGLPVAVGPCLEGIALAAFSTPGLDGNGDLAPLLHDVRCTGYVDSSPYNHLTDGPDYLNRPLDFVPPAWPQTGNEIVESMVWAGFSDGAEVTVNTSGSAYTYTGHGFLGVPWEEKELIDRDDLSDFISVVVAKLNAFPIPVPVLLNADYVVRNDPQGEYTVLESVIVSKYDVVNGIPFGETLFFKADLPANECANPAQYFDERTCHDPATGSCVPHMDVLPAGDVSLYCKDKDGNPAHDLYEPGLNCMGRRVLRVWVKPGGLKSDPASPCYM